MNKTVNINLGGLFFYIDEDAYQKMTRYFAAIKRSLNNSNGQDEIIKDIEMRVAELISEKHTTDKQVISMQELDEVIAVMGQPEDYRLDNEESDTKSTASSTYATNANGSKKLFRDRENGMIGGVMAGLGYYFGVEKVWLRLALLLLLIFYGTGLLIYIILWIVIPEAVSTSEKLEMRGEPINLSNIEKQVREGIETVSDKIKNANYDKFSSEVGKVGSSFGDFIIVLLGLFAKFIGVLLILIGAGIIITLIIGLLSTSSIVVFDGIPWNTFLTGGGFTDYPIWIVGLLIFLSVSIPAFGLILLGLRMLVPTTKSIGSTAKYTLTAVCIMATIALFAIGMDYASAFSVEGRTVTKQPIFYNPKDTLTIKFVHNDFFAKSTDEDNFMITEDSLKRKIIYNNEVEIEILQTESISPYFEIEKQAKGRNMNDAREKASKIIYNYKIQGNNLIFDNYLTTDLQNKYRDQEVTIKLYLPKGTYFKVDKSVQDYDRSDNEYFNLHYSSDDYIYKVEKNKVACLNCPADENEYDDITNAAIQEAEAEAERVASEVAEEASGIEETETNSRTAPETKTVSVKVNGKEILRSETNSKTTKLEINEDGIITKTK